MHKNKILITLFWQKTQILIGINWTNKEGNKHPVEIPDRKIAC